MQMKTFYVTAILSVFLAGCVNPINLHTGEQYYQGGIENAKQDKWFNARMAYGRAWTNADIGKADDRTTAVYAYEYGRASGAICDWKEAEHGLLKALELDKKTNGPVHMSLYELARMYRAQGMHEKAEEYFVKTDEKMKAVNAEERDPIGYADFLKEYAQNSNSLGKATEASRLTSLETKIRKTHPGKTRNGDRTPYGQFCDQKSLTKHSTRTFDRAARLATPSLTTRSNAG